MTFLKITSCVVVSALLLAACGGKTETAAPQAQQSSDAGTAPAKVINDITGAGASFPQPIYAKWAQAFQEAGKGRVNYQSIGSSGGIKQIIAKTVDFGASDAPMAKEELDKNGLIQFPTVIGGVVPVVNLDGVAPGRLKLDGAVLAEIYLGKITRWNDPKIQALNSDIKLPDQPITTVFRSDGSGTSFIFTTYLSQVSPDWKASVGADKTVNWPTAKTGAAGKGNEGVAAYVGRIKNSIGYVEYAYAKQNNMAYTQLKNAAGEFVAPAQDTFAAAADADWKSAPGFNLVLTNQTAPKAWPIAAATFILVHKQPADAAKTKAALEFFDWAYTNGDSAAAELDYVPLPDSVKTLIREEWKQVVGTNGKAVY